MPRSEVYQLRLAPGEKAKLKRLAGDESIAQMIRRTFGLDTEEPEGTTQEPIVVIEADGEALEARTSQLHGQGYTWPIARRMAREELKEID